MLFGNSIGSSFRKIFENIFKLFLMKLNIIYIYITSFENDTIHHVKQRENENIYIFEKEEFHNLDLLRVK